MQCVILAGGLGTRMRDLDPSVPKALLPVAGQPFAHWQLSWLASQKIDVVYSIGYKGNMIREYVGDGSRWGICVRYVEEADSLLGTGGAVRLAVDQGAVGERFFVLYGDAYLQISLASVDEHFRRYGHRALMTVFENQGRWGQSNVVFGEGMVVRYTKDCLTPPTNMRHIDYGLSEVERRLIAECIPPGEPYDLSHFFARLSLEGRLAGYEVMERYYEVGSPEGLRETESFIAAQHSGDRLHSGSLRE